MNEGLFRQKSIDKVSSPESLNDYVKVASPSVWLILIGIIVLLVGVCIWGITGRLDTVVNAAVVSEDEGQILYISEEDINKINVGMDLQINDENCQILEIDGTPKQGKLLSPIVLHALDIDEDEWAYEVKISKNFPKGEYETSIVIESVSPMSFVIN